MVRPAWLPSPPVDAHRVRLERPAGDLVADWIIAVVHDGAATLSSGHGSQMVSAGEAVLVVPGSIIRIEPHDPVTFTFVSMDGHWLDQIVYWHRDNPPGRRGQQRWTLPAWREPAIRRGTIPTAAVPVLSGWLDELVAMTAPDAPVVGVARVQALALNVIDTVAEPLGLDTPALSWASAPGAAHRSVIELRPEVHATVERLRSDLARRWTLAALASEVHLSVSQLGRLLVAAFGKPPIAFLTVTRVQELAHRLRTTTDPIPACAQAVGWSNASFAARQFRKVTGMTPSAYRRLPIPGRGLGRPQEPRSAHVSP